MQDEESILPVLDRKQMQKVYSHRYRQKQLATKESAEAFRQKQALQSKTYRNRVKHVPVDSNSSPYKTPNTRGKALRKLKSYLPKDPLKAKELIQALANEYLVVPSIDSQPVKKIRKNFVGTPEAVSKFYVLDNISRQLRGNKNFVTIKNSNGEKEKIQKRTMLMTLSEAHEKFVEMFPAQPISLSKFSSLRPRNILVLVNKHKTPWTI